MGILIGVFIILFIIAAIFKVIEAGVQGVDHGVPFVRMFGSRWAVTQKGGIYVFRGRWYAPTQIVSVDWRGSVEPERIDAAKRVAKYANDNKLRGLPVLAFSTSRLTPQDVHDEVKSWHEGGGGKGGRVIEV